MKRFHCVEDRNIRVYMTDVTATSALLDSKEPPDKAAPKVPLGRAIFTPKISVGVALCQALSSVCS